MSDISAQFPNDMWDGMSPDTQRVSLVQNKTPSGIEWRQITAELQATQQRLLDAISDLEAAQGQISGFEWKGEYNSDNDYVVNNLVQHEGSAYICIADNGNGDPKTPGVDEDAWDLFASKGDQGEPG